MMSFEIDLGTQDNRPIPKAASIDGHGVSYAHRGDYAERHHRQIIEAIQTCESRADLDEYVEAEAPILDAMDRTHPHFADAIREAADDCRACLPDRDSA